MFEWWRAGGTENIQQTIGQCKSICGDGQCSPNNANWGGAQGQFERVYKNSGWDKILKPKLLKDYITLIAKIYSFRASDVYSQRYEFHKF